MCCWGKFGKSFDVLIFLLPDLVAALHPPKRPIIGSSARKFISLQGESGREENWGRNIGCKCFNSRSTLPETNSSPLKMDGWNITFLLGRSIFRGYLSFREGTDFIIQFILLTLEVKSST